MSMIHGFADFVAQSKPVEIEFEGKMKLVTKLAVTLDTKTEAFLIFPQTDSNVIQQMGLVKGSRLMFSTSVFKPVINEVKGPEGIKTIARLELFCTAEQLALVHRKNEGKVSPGIVAPAQNPIPKTESKEPKAGPFTDDPPTDNISGGFAKKDGTPIFQFDPSTATLPPSV